MVGMRTAKISVGHWLLSAVGVAVMGAAAACGSGNVIRATENPINLDGGLKDGASGGGGTLGVGQPCGPAALCRAGLVCAGTCAPGHSLDIGAACVLNAECKEGSFCGPTRTCVIAGTKADGATCKSDGDCATGLRCLLKGLSAQCRPEGNGDVGAACATNAQCFGGLACTGKACTPYPESDEGVPLLAAPAWKGTACEDVLGPVQAYFRIPRVPGEGEFFRLPFPNDARLAENGRPVLTGFPTTGDEVLGYDLVDRYLRDIERSAVGFSRLPTLYFRFSGAVNFDTFKASGAMRLADVTTTGGNEVSFNWTATNGRTGSMCANTLRVRPLAPLVAGHTYAFLLSDAVKTTEGVTVARGEDFGTVLSPAAPAEAALAAAHVAYKPLRDWLNAHTLAASSFVGGTVFRVGDTGAPMEQVAAAVAAAPLAVSSAWVKCGAAPSPCPDASGNRACGGAAATFDEYHALVSLPRVQQGTPPYLTPEQGGDVEVVGNTAKVQGSDNVCMSLTVPKGTMPAAGWPLVVFAHGTGGSFRSAVESGLAARLAAVDDGAGGTLGVAVLGIDQVGHGPRRGGSAEPPADVVFNYGNPAAARGNFLQAAADQLALARFAKALDLAAGVSPTGANLKFSGMAFFGQGQGATAIALAMPHAGGSVDSGVGGAALAGIGGGMAETLLGRQNPVNSGEVLRAAFSETNTSVVDGYYPILSLIQAALESVDPLMSAARIAASPPAAGAGKHLFMAYGQGDTVAGPSAQRFFALAAGVGLLAPPPGVTNEALGNLTAVPVPANPNLTDGARPLSVFVRQYAPNSYDGHDVAFRDAVASRDVARFLLDVARGTAPSAGR